MSCENCKNSSVQMPTDVSVITTYRCQMRCKMCNIWKNPTKKTEEVQARDLEILPGNLKFANITGGEPFIRQDLEDIVEVMFTKAPRIVISTSGWWVERTIKLAEKFPDIGIRVSIEGLEQTNNFLRGRDDGFEKGMRTLRTLHEMGVKDIGFGQTLRNWKSWPTSFSRKTTPRHGSAHSSTWVSSTTSRVIRVPCPAKPAP